jgi:DNA replication protein DnaC
MTFPTTVGEELPKLNPRPHATRTAQTHCTEHPDQQALTCPACLDRRRAETRREEQRRDVLAEAEHRCIERFPQRYRHAVTEHPQVLAWVEQFHADPANAPSLLLLGPTGTGKSYQGYATVRAATAIALPTRVGSFTAPRWQALTFADMCASLRPRGRDYDPEAVLERYRTLELLFLDDLGAGKLTEFTEESTYRLLNGRYSDMRPSIFTSNLAVAQLKDAIGDRIASRLAETCTRVVLDGPDRRRQPKIARPATAPREGPDPERPLRTTSDSGVLWNN